MQTSVQVLKHCRNKGLPASRTWLHLMHPRLGWGIEEPGLRGGGPHVACLPWALQERGASPRCLCRTRQGTRGGSRLLTPGQGPWRSEIASTQARQGQSASISRNWHEARAAWPPFQLIGTLPEYQLLIPASRTQDVCYVCATCRCK